MLKVLVFLIFVLHFFSGCVSAPKSQNIRGPSSVNSAKHCGMIVVEGDGPRLYEGAHRWDLSQVDGNPIRFAMETPWFYCSCVQGSVALNPDRFVSVDDVDLSEDPAAIRCPSVIRSPLSHQAIPNSLINQMVKELRPLIRSVPATFLVSTYTTRKTLSRLTPEAYQATAIPYFFDRTTPETASQDPNVDVNGFYAAADPYASRFYGESDNGSRDFVLLMNHMAKDQHYLDIRDEDHWSNSTFKSLRDYGCVVPNGELQLRAVLMQSDHGRCREIAVRVLQALDVASIWYHWSMYILPSKYLPSCQNPLTAFLILKPTAFNGSPEVFTAEGSLDGAHNDEKDYIQNLTQYISDNNGADEATMFWPGTQSSNSAALSWAKTNLLGCFPSNQTPAPVPSSPSPAESGVIAKYCGAIVWEASRGFFQIIDKHQNPIIPIDTDGLTKAAIYPSDYQHLADLDHAGSVTPTNDCGCVTGSVATTKFGLTFQRVQSAQSIDPGKCVKAGLVHP